MKNKNLYLVLLLALILGQADVVKANSGNPMDVQTNTQATVTVSASEDQKELTNEEKAEIEKQCEANREMLAKAVAKYNFDNKVEMTALNMKNLLEGKYVASDPAADSKTCKYTIGTKHLMFFKEAKYIVCPIHGSTHIGDYKAEKVEDQTEEKAEEKVEEKPQIVTHTVKQGESLWRIAQQYLGDGNRWRELIDLNKEAYPSIEKNPDLIYTGWQIQVQLDKTEEPAKEEDIKNADEEQVSDTTENVEVTDNSKDSSEVEQSTLPNWTTIEKMDRLQRSLDLANQDLRAQHQKIADLNSQTIKWMVKYGYLKQEDWMAMNPPLGYTYRINKYTGKIELVDAKNVALTSAEIKALDSKLATEQKQQEEAKKDKEKAQKDEKKSENLSTRTDIGKDTYNPKYRDQKKGEEAVNHVIVGKDTYNPIYRNDTNNNKKNSTNPAKELGRSFGNLVKTITDVGKDVAKAGKELGKAAEETGKEIAREAKQTGKEIKEAAQETGREIKETTQEVKEGLKQTGRNIKEGVQETGREIKRATKDVKEGFEEAGKDIRDGFRDARDEFRDGYNEGKSGSTTHTSSSGATHGGAGRSFSGRGGRGGSR